MNLFDGWLPCDDLETGLYGCMQCSCGHVVHGEVLGSLMNSDQEEAEVADHKPRLPEFPDLYSQP